VEAWSRTYEFRWSDLDSNGHINYAAYIDAAGDLRYRFFAEQGFPPERFVMLGLGPIYAGLTARFLREVRLGEIITITYSLTGLSSSRGHWKVHHDMLRANGKRAVSLDIDGAFLHLATRKLALPPPELAEIFDLVPRAPDFAAIPDSPLRA
jgi:acyl-CoA thioester hydrolase